MSHAQETVPLQRSPMHMTHDTPPEEGLRVE
jgi:hypothetical protein